MSIIRVMSKKAPKIFPSEAATLKALGERIRLARKRRKIDATVAAARTGVSRTTYSRVEAGSPTVAMGVYFRALAILHLESDLEKVAQDDKLGRELQDLELKRGSS